MTDYTALTYQELRENAKSRGIDASGTKDELITRLKEADGVQTPSAPATGAAQPPVNNTNIDRLYKSRAMQMKAILDAQPKVSIFIPFEQGENPTMAAKLPQIVNIKGYQFTIPRGRYVEVPKQVAEMIQERLESENKAGREYLVTGDEKRENALS